MNWNAGFELALDFATALGVVAIVVGVLGMLMYSFTRLGTWAEGRWGMAAAFGVAVGGMLLVLLMLALLLGAALGAAE